MLEQLASGQIQVSEYNELLKLLESPQSGEVVQVLTDFYKPGNVSRESSEVHDYAYWQNALEEILDVAAMNRYLQEKPIIKIPFYQQNWLRYAAMVIVLLGASLFFYLQHRKNESNAIAQNTAVPATILPGSNKAWLTLSTGERLSLTDLKSGEVAQDAGLQITQSSAGELVYTIQHAHSAAAEEYNTIETPNGGQYQIRLPDGTTVFLNATSRLTYPLSFNSKNERRVSLIGEAYFDVPANKLQPFKVTSGDQEVEVLGTTFNIKAYENEPAIKTTLLEGSVKVHPLLAGANASPAAPEKKSVILQPGEQALNDANKLVVNPVNAEQVVDWKNGYFRFTNKTLEEGMREIERWYNVQISYKREDLKQIMLGGRISKYENISQVLKKMELTGAFHFKINDRKIQLE